MQRFDFRQTLKAFGKKKGSATGLHLEIQGSEIVPHGRENITLYVESQKFIEN